ncbi:response regulator [Glaciecola sp. 1036]|uniref:response regulator n=1 Tax=Alteromonadaceae TaxID=72275 RepID=UPI003CFD342E
MEYNAESTQDMQFRVMVIDDNDIELKLYANTLSKHFSLAFAKSGEKAWELLHNNPLPDTILLDVLMPDEDGIQFCTRLRNSQYTQNIPVIFVSSQDDPAVKAKAFESGGADFITKPAATTELVARIMRHATQYRKTKRLESLIFIDPLTHLPNASKFRDVLAREWSRCARYWHHISLIFVRLENIQDYKNAYGQEEYFRLTAAIAEALSGLGARPGDLFASLDNDLFGLLLSDCSVDGANLKAKQIEACFDDPHFITNREETASEVSCTIVVAVAAPAGGGNAKELFRAGEDLLFQAKEMPQTRIIELGRIIGVDGIGAA